MPAEPDDRIAALEARLAALEARLTTLDALQVPGWTPSNLTCTSSPVLSICRNSVSGEWSVWQIGLLAPIAVGKTAREAVAKLGVSRAG